MSCRNGLCLNSVYQFVSYDSIIKFMCNFNCHRNAYKAYVLLLSLSILVTGKVLVILT